MNKAHIVACLFADRGRTHTLKVFFSAITRFGGFWIEWKQKQKVVVFYQKMWSGHICGVHQPKIPLFWRRPFWIFLFWHSFRLDGCCTRYQYRYKYGVIESHCSLFVRRFKANFANKSLQKRVKLANFIGLGPTSMLASQNAPNTLTACPCHINYWS